MATLYIEGEHTYTIEDSEKVVLVMVDRKMYALSAETMEMFENIHNEWELNIVKNTHMIFWLEVCNNCFAKNLGNLETS